MRPDPTAYILLVEDDESLGFLLQEYLKLKGYDVTWLQDGHDVLRQVQHRRPDLCILDIMMPTVDGFQVAAQLRESMPGLPFMFLSARSLKTDVLKGFQLGADDYVKKPVDEEELLARVQVILKRNQSAPANEEVLHIGQYLFHPQKQTLTLADSSIKLTRRESDLLHMLARQAGQLVSSSELLETLWGKDDFFARKSMDVYSHKLRKHLEGDPDVQITNVHGRGFFLEEK